MPLKNTYKENLVIYCLEKFEKSYSMKHPPELKDRLGRGVFSIAAFIIRNRNKTAPLSP